MKNGSSIHWCLVNVQTNINLDLASNKSTGPPAGLPIAKGHHILDFERGMMVVIHGDGIVGTFDISWSKASCCNENNRKTLLPTIRNTVTLTIRDVYLQLSSVTDNKHRLKSHPQSFQEEPDVNHCSLTSMLYDWFICFFTACRHFAGYLSQKIFLGCKHFWR